VDHPDGFLTAEQFYRSIEAVERQPTNPAQYLMLPDWFPAAQRDFADEWAKQHGWAGVAYHTRTKRGRPCV